MKRKKKFGAINGLPRRFCVVNDAAAAPQASTGFFRALRQAAFSPWRCWRWRCSLYLFGAVYGWLGAFGGAAETTGRELPGEELVARVRAATCFIGGGCGVVISAAGEIVTNNHVVADVARTTVTFSNGRSYAAVVLGRDERGDLALLQVDFPPAVPLEDFAFLPTGDSDLLQVGAACFAAGNPYAQQEKVLAFSAGVISALHQFRQGYNDAIVTDAAINPGNSGGPLVNRQGELIGICGMTQTRLGLKSNTGVAFAIPVNQLKVWLPFLRQAGGGSVAHGRLVGLGLREYSGAVLVVTPGQTSLQKDDTLLTAMHFPVRTRARFDGIIGALPAGSEVTLQVWRDGQEITVTAVLTPLRLAKKLFTLNAAPADAAPLAYDVVPESAAARAGLRDGDTILSINDLPTNPRGLTQAAQYLAGLYAGDEVALSCRRGDKNFRVKFIAE
jgi:S1-C subfamily serine protease